MVVRVSVVIAAYNAAPWLAQTLRSVAMQVHAADEIIVVDDGSTDATAAIAVTHGARVIRIANGGVSAARNCGIRAARHEWIALLDADDLWSPQKLARQVSAIELDPHAAIVSCDHYQFADSGAVRMPSLFDTRRDRWRRLQPVALASGIFRFAGMGCGLIAFGQALFPSTLMVRRALALDIGGFDVELRRCEDYEFLLRALAHGDLLVVDEPLMGYRQHPQGLSGNAEAMTQALVRMGECLAAHPERYAPGAALAFAPRLHEALVESAAFHLGRREVGPTRELLARAGAIRHGSRWWSVAFATCLPSVAVDALSALRRRSRTRP